MLVRHIYHTLFGRGSVLHFVCFVGFERGFLPGSCDVYDGMNGLEIGSFNVHGDGVVSDYHLCLLFDVVGVSHCVAVTARRPFSSRHAI